MEENKTVTPEETAPEADAPKEAPKAEAKTDKKKQKKLEAELSSANALVEEKTKALEEANEKYLRMMAEYDNFRKRSAKEKEGIYADAFGDCITNLLPVLDNLERAGKSDNLEAVKKGLEMTAKAFSDALEKMGIAEVETASFDPNLHNAVMHVEDEAFGEGEILEVFQKGYRKGDKIIRYAMVKVAN